MSIERAVAGLVVALIFFAYVSFEYLRVSNRLLRRLRENHNEIWNDFTKADDALNLYRQRLGIGRFMIFVFSGRHAELNDGELSDLVVRTRYAIVLCPVAWILLIASLAILAAVGSL